MGVLFGFARVFTIADLTGLMLVLVRKDMDTGLYSLITTTKNILF